MKKGKRLGPWRLAVLGAAAAMAATWAYLHYRFTSLARAAGGLPAAEVRPGPPFDLRGAVHVHTEAGGHSLGTLDEVAAAARASATDFVILTEHPRARDWEVRYRSLPGRRPVLIFGEEIQEETRRVLVVQAPDGGGPSRPLRIATHWMAAPQEGVMEIINLHEELDAAPRLAVAAAIAGAWPGLLSYFPLPLQGLYAERLRQWDEILKRRTVWGVGGNDAHANLGLRIEFGDGRRLLDWRLDAYRRSFGYLGTHVWVDEQNAGPEAILESLAGGRSYLALDVLHDARGFLFSADGGMSREVAAGATLRAWSPLPARIRLLRDGATVGETGRGTRLEHASATPGAYRVEVYLPELGAWAARNPWILSNPIFVRPAAGELPGGGVAP